MSENTQTPSTDTDKEKKGRNTYKPEVPDVTVVATIVSIVFIQPVTFAGRTESSLFTQPKPKLRMKLLSNGYVKIWEIGGDCILVPAPNVNHMRPDNA